MTTKHRVPSDAIGLAEIEAIMIQAQAYRAEVVREMTGLMFRRVAALLKRLTAHLRPSRHHLPHKGAWA